MTAFNPTSATSPEQLESATQFEQTFATGDHCRLVLENPRGRVRVAGWDRPEVSVNATKRWGSSSRERFEATRIEAQHHGDTVVVRTIFDRWLFVPSRETNPDSAAQLVRALTDLTRSRNNSPAEVVYDVRVPQLADLEVKGVSSDLVVEDVRGDLDLSTVSGELTGRALAGSLHMKSVSGDVKIAGQIDAVKASSVSGDIELTGTLSQTGTYQANTVSGDLTLRVRPDTAASICASGVSVKVVCELPHEVTRNAHRPGSRQWEGRVNGGGADVQFHSVSGTLRLIEWLDGSNLPTTDPEQTSSQGFAQAPMQGDELGRSTSESSENDLLDDSEVMAILRALERGEMTVDDALRQIDALRPGEMLGR